MSPTDHANLLLAAKLADAQQNPRRQQLSATLGEHLGSPDQDPLERMAFQLAMAERDRGMQQDFARETANADRAFTRERDTSRYAAADRQFDRQRGAEREDRAEGRKWATDDKAESRRWTTEDWDKENRRRENEATTAFTRSEQVRTDEQRFKGGENAQQQYLQLVGEKARLEGEGSPVPPELEHALLALRQTAGLPSPGETGTPAPTTQPAALPLNVRRAAAAEALAKGDVDGAKALMAGKPTPDDEIRIATERNKKLEAAAAELDSTSPWSFRPAPWNEQRDYLDPGFWSAGSDRALERAKTLQEQMPEFRKFGIKPEDIVSAYRRID